MSASLQVLNRDRSPRDRPTVGLAEAHKRL